MLGSRGTQFLTNTLDIFLIRIGVVPDVDEMRSFFKLFCLGVQDASCFPLIPSMLRKDRAAPRFRALPLFLRLGQGCPLKNFGFGHDDLLLFPLI